uniref:Uncharacterized protein n=1 Tax=Rhizophora mucronata TaxID=61149 RepID=A0A2P2QRH6_RHIMU
MALLYVAYTIPKREPRQTNLVVCVPDHFACPDASAIAAAGKTGPNFHILQF